MRVAVYAICKNEVGNVNRWLDAILPDLRDGDSLTVLDTGSTDGTVEAFHRRGVVPFHGVVRPWRFDAARNAALALAPDADAAWSLDLDEFPQPGWRQAIEDAWVDNITRLRYEFVWNFAEDGSPGITFMADKLHTREGFVWRGIAHEWLVREGGKERHVPAPGLTVHHHQEQGRGRMERDNAVIERAVAELPDDARLQHYWARQLLWNERLDEAAAWFRRHLDNPAATWKPERAWSMRYLAQCLPDEREVWLMRASSEAPGYREPWVDLAKHYHAMGQWHSCYACDLTALMIHDRDLAYLVEPEAWGAAPHDLAALAAYHLGHHAEAVRHGEEAVRLAPGDERLKNNMTWYRRAPTP